MFTKKRANKTKEELASQMKHLAKIEREKALVKLIFPAIAEIKTIYDAQTVLGAMAGFVKAKLDEKTSEIRVEELIIDLSKEEDSEIKNAITQLLGLLGPEKARDTALLLERFGNILAQHSAQEFMKKPMKEIKIEQIIA